MEVAKLILDFTLKDGIETAEGRVYIKATAQFLTLNQQNRTSALK